MEKMLGAMMENQVINLVDGSIFLGVLVVLALISGIFVRQSKQAEDKVKTFKDKLAEQSAKVDKSVHGVSVSAFKLEELEKLTKVKLDEFGEAKGIKLDRRKTKKNMIEDLLNSIEGNNHKLGK